MRGQKRRQPAQARPVAVRGQISEHLSSTFDPAPTVAPHLAHIVLAHGCDRAEYQLLAADALEGFLHFTQELLELERACESSAQASE